MRSFAAAILLFVVAFFTGARAETFSYSDLLSEETPTIEAISHLNGLVQQRTGGRYTFREAVHSIADTDNFTVTRVQSGQIAMARVRLATFHGWFPEAILPSFPYFFKSHDSLRRALEGPLGEAILARLPERGLIGLCYYDTGVRSFYAKQPIRQVADLKRLRLRVQGGDVFAQVLQAIGAVPQQVPLGRVADALKTGLIDGADLDLLTFAGARHYETARYFSFTEHSMAPSILIFSRQIWEKLGKEEQTIIKAAAQESASYLRNLWHERETSARRRLENAGVKFIEDVDKASFSDAMVPAFSSLLSERARGWLKKIEQ